MVPIDLVYSIYDSTEEAIKKMIEANERIMALGGVQRDALNTATKRVYELQVETLQNAPTDKAELERLLELKQKQRRKLLTLKIQKDYPQKRLKC